MPYTKQKNRRRIDENNIITNVGELTYKFTTLMNQYLRDRGLSYQTISLIKGALDGAYDDFNDRVVIPYERKKLKENGDVWDKEFTGGEKE